VEPQPDGRTTLCPRYAVDCLLRELGHNCTHVGEIGMSRAADEEILAWQGPDSRAAIGPTGPAGLDALIELVEQAGLDGIDFSREHPPGLRTRMRDHYLLPVVWTVNDVETAQLMIEAGIRSITTDLPGQLRVGLLG